MSGEEQKPRASVAGHMASEVMRLAAWAAVGNGAARPGDDRIEKIRHILFGDQLQQITRQLTYLESLVQQETAELREALVRRCDALEAYLKTEVASLHARLTTEQHTRADAIEKLARDAAELAHTFETKTAQLAEQTAERQGELRELMLEQSKTLAEDIRDRYDDLSALLEQQLEDLRQVKTDRSALASLFGEMATRLNHDERRLESDEKPAQ